MMAVDVESAAGFRAGAPRALFAGAIGAVWDRPVDGKRFLVETSPIEGGESRINYVTNRFEELRRLAPARK